MPACSCWECWWAPVWRTPMFALVLAVNFLPWSLPAIEVWWRNFREGRHVADPNYGTAARRPSRQFILAWGAVLVAGFALGSNVSVRYLLPAAPLLAILVADVLAGAGDMRLIFSPREILKFLLWTLGVLLSVAIVVNSQWRVTLLPGAMLAAKHNVCLVTGAEKAEAVRAVFHEEYDPKRYPAQKSFYPGKKMSTGAGWRNWKRKRATTNISRATRS